VPQAVTSIAMNNAVIKIFLAFMVFSFFIFIKGYWVSLSTYRFLAEIRRHRGIRYW
jgi:hypothetical protein